MCGIGGMLRIWPAEQRELALRTPHGESLAGQRLDCMDTHLAVRGPDGSGRFRDRVIAADGSVVDLALTHKRLSIIDLAGGQQPMVLRIRTGVGAMLMPVEERDAYTRRIEAADLANQSDTLSGPSDQLIALVFNGCIYNHRELRRELQALGSVFASDHSDTEVIVHGWHAWGAKLFERLNGMFAIAIWDRATATITLARDRFGEKPLYHTHTGANGTGTLFAFSSEAASLGQLHLHGGSLAASGVQDNLDDWVRYGHADHAPGKLLRAVEPSTMRTLGVQGEIARGYGPIAGGDRPQIPTRENPLAMAEAKGLVERAVHARLEADVDLGCFLSGGIDSTTIAAIARRKLGRLRTFTMRMPDVRYDESPDAAAVAKAIGSEHTTLDCEARPAEDLVGLIHQLGLPFGDSSLLPTMWLCRAAREHVKVALSGDGGDEMFVGYERYWGAESLRRRRLLVSMLPGRLLPRRHPKSWTTKLARLIEASQGLGYLELVSIFPSPLLRELLGRHERPGEDQWAWLGMSNAVAWDIARYLPNDLLRKTDTASMSVALEVRCPFLDPALALACMEAPLSDLLVGGRLKGLLRAIAGTYVDPALIDRPKMGFAIPIGEWFRTDYGGMRTLLLDHLNSTEPFGSPSLGIGFNMKLVRRLLDEHMGTGRSGMVKQDHGQRLYMLLVLSIWAKWMGVGNGHQLPCIS